MNRPALFFTAMIDPRSTTSRQRRLGRASWIGLFARYAAQDVFCRGYASATSHWSGKRFGDGSASPKRLPEFARGWKVVKDG